MSTKESILDTALDLFSAEGYEAVPVSMIAQRLGITKPALYKHYENKRDIFQSIVRRMEELDRRNAESFALPTGGPESEPGAYTDTELQGLIDFSYAQFIYWTEDPFASRFRCMLGLERYRDREMAALYSQYLGAGPLKYTGDILAAILQKRGIAADSSVLAMQFYGPMFTLMSLYDGQGINAKALLKEHFCKFKKDFEALM